MATLQLLLVVGLLVYSLFSGITYLMRRSENKQALRSLQQGAGQPVRRLDPNERAALEPFLFEPANPARAMPLQGDGVHLLEGAYLQHGLSTGQGGSVMHHTIGDVEVILPYDAADFLEPHNRAEVVFGSKCAIVVRLNGSFDLPGAHARAQRRQQQTQQWQSGRSGEVTDVDPEGVAEVVAAVQEQADDGLDGARAAEVVRDALRVEILGQRDETPAEMAARHGPGLGLLAGLAWALTFAGLGIASAVDPDDRLFWLLPSLVLAASGAWWAWGKRRAAVPQKVNRVRGHVTVLDMPLGGTAGTTLPRWFLGNKFQMNLPAHWQGAFAVPEGPVEAEMRVDDQTVVRLGKALSVDEEVRRFAPVHWGRHASLALVGAGGLGALALAFSVSGLQDDLRLGAAWISRATPMRLETPAAFSAALPAVGTPVSLTGRAPCGVGHEPGLHIDCTRLRWGGAAVAAADLQPDALTLALHEGGFLETRRDPRLEMLLQIQAMQALGSADPLARYQATLNQPTLIAGLPAMVRSVEEACPQTSPACETLHQAIVEGVHVDEDTQPAAWSDWVRETGTGRLSHADAAGVARADAVGRIRDAARAVADTRIAALVQAATARHAGQGGVELAVLTGSGARLPENPMTSDGLEALAWLQGADGEPGRSAFRIDGLVAAIETGAGGVPRVWIDASRHLGDPWSALMRASALVVALGLLLGHGVMAVMRLRAAGARRRAVAAHNESRWNSLAF
ncbi:IgaA/UmoB family intracellular growth attenuator [Rhizobacter sp. LjRoot28]|uniref:IgaA/UmoB family intracellular growth attenuator n=1 Tax=Rhizobacter sp. LjRoot28 TaxID=3342309 RepID=UPI003ED07068